MHSTMSCRSVTRVAMIVLLGLLVSGGCATLPPRADIPLGTWEGEGIFVFKGWDKGAEEYDAEEMPSTQNTYPTTLTIEQTTYEDEPVTKVEIVSLRGPMHGEDDGDRTHIILYLKLVDRISNDISFWKAVDMLISFSEDDKPEHGEASDVPINATCMRYADGIAFQIRYTDGFTDNLRFQGRHVRKLGIYHPESDDESQGLIHWAEVLERR